MRAVELIIPVCLWIFANRIS